MFEKASDERMENVQVLTAIFTQRNIQLQHVSKKYRDKVQDFYTSDFSKILDPILNAKLKRLTNIYRTNKIFSLVFINYELDL